MNKVILVGRLTKDPELRKTNTDISVVQFALAVNRTYQSRNGERQADFINCVAWRNLADLLAKYMRKGSLMGVEGQLQTRTYEDNTGAKRYVTEVICENIHFLESKGTRENGGFSDINSYDIPEDRNSNQGFGGQLSPFGSQQMNQNKVTQQPNPFAFPQQSGNQNTGTQQPNPFEVPQQPKSPKPEDPFASFSTKGGISDDDLPF